MIKINSNYQKSKFQILREEKGQSLIEIMIALGIGTILIGAAVFAVVFMMKSSKSNQKTQAASLLARSLADQVHAVASGNWFDVYNLVSTTNYFVIASGTTLGVVQGEQGVWENERFGGLVADWGFDEATGTVAEDATGNNNDAALVNGVTRLGSCQVSWCVSFDGTNDYASSSNSSSLTLSNAMTIGAWVKASSTSSAVILAKNDGTNFSWELALESGKLIGRVNAAGNVAQSTSTVSTSTWTYVAMSFDGSTINLYVNGVLDGTTSYVSSVNTTTVAVSIGRRLSGTPGYYNGLLDDVRIYNQVLTADEIMTLYNSSAFTRYFSITNVSRDGAGNIVSSGGTDDPSTRQVTIFTDWVVQGSTTSSISLVDYVTRWKNRAFTQTDWSGGNGFEGPITDPNSSYSSSTNIATSSGAIKIDGL